MEAIDGTSLKAIFKRNAPHQCIRPQIFVDLVYSSLQETFQCEYERGVHVFSNTCSERLYILSAIHASFEYSFDNRVRSNMDKSSDMISTMDPLNEACQDVSVCHFCSKINSKDGSSNENHQLSTNEQSWYRHVIHSLTADDAFIVQVLSFQEWSQCMFASHLVKKIIDTLTKQQNKISVVVNYIQKNWRSNKINVNELELVNLLMSKKQNGDDPFVREQVYTWLMDEVGLYLKTSFVQELRVGKNKKQQKQLAIVSVIGKCLKYSSSSGKEIPACMGALILDILDSYHNIFFSSTAIISEQDMKQLIFLKFVKALNIFIQIHYGLEKAHLSDMVVNVCNKILQFSIRILDMCVEYKYMTMTTFWGNKDLDNNNSEGIGPGRSVNVVVARELFLLVMKSSALLSCAEGSVKGHVFTSIKIFWECLESWMTKHCASQTLGLMPFLFGDQDDKWISALFSLLIIYHNMSVKGLLISSSTDMEQNEGTSDEDIITSMAGKGPSTIDKEIVTTTKKMQNVKSLWNFICPHKLYLQFVDFISLDHLVLSDFLMSPETSFLEYFTKYLTYLDSSWKDFVAFCNSQGKCITTENYCVQYKNCSVSKETLLCADEFNSVEIPLEIEQSLKRVCDNNLSESNVVQSKYLKLDVRLGSLVPYVQSDSDNDSSSDFSANDEDVKSSSPYDNRFLHKDKFKLECRNDPSTSTYAGNSTCELKSATGTVFCKKTDVNAIPIMLDRSNDSKQALLSSSSSADEWNTQLDENEKDEHYPIVCGNEESHDSDRNILECVMTMLIRLRLHLERLDNHQLVPYKTDLLLNLLNSCEERYENMS